MQTKKLTVAYEAPCRQCGGFGYRLSEPCAFCGATGYVDITKHIDITITPSFTRDVKIQSETINQN